MDEVRERAIRARHEGHPFDDACYVLAQLDIERAAHKLDTLTLEAEIKSLHELLDKAKGLG